MTTSHRKALEDGDRENLRIAKGGKVAPKTMRMKHLFCYSVRRVELRLKGGNSHSLMRVLKRYPCCRYDRRDVRSVLRRLLEPDRSPRRGQRGDELDAAGYAFELAGCLKVSSSKSYACLSDC